jgi:hypothetical protein
MMELQYSRQEILKSQLEKDEAIQETNALRDAL